MPGRATHTIKKNSDGSITLEYQPTEKGLHELNISVNEKPTEGMSTSLLYTI